MLVLYIVVYRKFATELRPFIDARIWFLLHILNEWTEFNQILYTHYLWQDLRWDCKTSFFCKFATELQPLIEFGQPWTAELAALDQWKKSFTY